MMTVEELTSKMVEASKDIEETITESRESFKKGVKRNLDSLNKLKN